ncbi:hypothetical protein HNY73_007531 [Argiope bruennichi]|uniref:Uncharacterized protein n=1 Tax=Argiope bruennichi TaxID=94029 RepID=A0A8T0FGS6_ARGBR|nr:hypothetical protein HNY73_007531 [Argiope bruennichi]
MYDKDKYKACYIDQAFQSLEEHIIHLTVRFVDCGYNMDPIAKSDDIKCCKDAIFYGKKKVAEVRRMLRRDPNSRVLAALAEKSQQELNKLYEKLQILTKNQQQGQRNDPVHPAPRPTTNPVVSVDSSPEKTSQKSTVATQPDEDMNVDDFIPVSPRKTAK